MPRTIIDDGTPTGRLTFICTVGCGGAALREMTLSFVSGTSISAIPARMRAFLPLTSMTVALLLVPMSCTVSPALSSCPVATTDSAVSFFSSRFIADFSIFWKWLRFFSSSRRACDSASAFSMFLMSARAESSALRTIESAFLSAFAMSASRFSSMAFIFAS